MANKFWVGGTGSASDTAHWATSSGGAGSTGIPAKGDVVTFDAATGGGTFNATNSLDQGRNTGWSITAPSGGGGQRVISG